MSKEEFIDEIDSMIDEESNIINLQSDDFNPSRLETLWEIKEMAIELDD